jgi:predicted NAD-dependent protein-ADP-ribosyltransferase YbiA (DUF1768 family)
MWLVSTGSLKATVEHFITNARINAHADTRYARAEPCLAGRQAPGEGRTLAREVCGKDVAALDRVSGATTARDLVPKINMRLSLHKRLLTTIQNVAISLLARSVACVLGSPVASMRAVIQRVKSASVTINGSAVSHIGTGVR